MHLLIILLLLFPATTLAAAEQLDDLRANGTQFRLKGDFNASYEIFEKIRNTAPQDPTYAVFRLNTLSTHLSWEESQTLYDDELLTLSATVLQWCENSSDMRANLYCGHSHFTLAFFNGLRGNYIRAGRHGSNAIDYFELALEAQPDLLEAKMYLGVSYYYADNLPSFLKVISRLLWFIPTGSSEKSLPYLQGVIESDSQFADVALYIYATLLIDGVGAEQQEAIRSLQVLVNRYPENTRFTLRLISVFVLEREFDLALAMTNAALTQQDISNLDLSLLELWKTQSLLGLGELDEATQAFNQVDLDGLGDAEAVPGWSMAWQFLTQAQLHDLNQQRKDAIENYQRVIDLGKKTFISPVLYETAEAGLKQPFRLSTD